MSTAKLCIRKNQMVLEGEDNGLVRFDWTNNTFISLQSNFWQTWHHNWIRVQFVNEWERANYSDSQLDKIISQVLTFHSKEQVNLVLDGP
jgi:hypothetical protein